MQNRIKFFVSLFLLMMSGHGCKDLYLPPEIVHATSLLVVDGFVNVGNDSTIIRLSRTRPIGTTDTSYQETGARVEVIADNQQIFHLIDMGDGRYVHELIPLQSGGNCTLRIIAKDGQTYESDPIPVKITPPIDSISVEYIPIGVYFSANTHDDTRESLYYQWEYRETWEYHSKFGSAVYWENDSLYFRDSTQQIFRCWQHYDSRHYILSTTAGSAADIVRDKQLVFVPRNNVRLEIMYNLDVRQKVLTKEAFDYWTTFSKFTEQLGSLFDVQPGELAGNIRNLSNPDEPVIGFISAYSVSEKTLFIENINDKRFPDWNYYTYPFPRHCEVVEKAFNQTIEEFFGMGATIMPISPGTGADSICVDCRLQGGYNVKPVFWPW